MEAYRLVTQSEYAKKCGKSRSIINYYVKKGYLNIEMISGVPYVKVPEDQFASLIDPAIPKYEKLKISWKYES